MRLGRFRFFLLESTIALIIFLALWFCAEALVVKSRASKFSSCEEQVNFGFLKDHEVWADLPVAFEIDESVPLAAVASIQKAAKDWEIAFGRPVITINEPKSSLFPIRQRSKIVWKMSPGPLAERLEGYTYTIAHQTILSADIEINPVDFAFNFDAFPQDNTLHLESLMVHEFGHALGLAHMAGGVMDPHLALGSVRTVVDDQSAASLKCMYERNESLVWKLVKFPAVVQSDFAYFLNQKRMNQGAQL